MTAKPSLSRQETDVLDVLAVNAPLTVQQLSSALHVSPGQLHRTLADLLAKGCVERDTDPDYPYEQTYRIAVQPRAS